MNHSARWSNVLLSPDRTESYLDYARGWEKRIGSFLELNPPVPASPPRGDLAGIPFAVKDNIAVEGFNLTCGSKMLAGLKSPYTATAVRRLQEAGALVVGKTNLDEFGMGSSTDTSALARTSNPWDTSLVAGGSSGGSAAAVASGIVPFALGSDTGGSIRQPAAFCGIYGLKPTYGAVSRYGLVAYASSLEGIGVVAESVGFARRVFEVIRGIDPLDHSSVEYLPSGQTPPRPRLGVVRGLAGLSGEIERAYRRAADLARELGMEVSEVDLKTFDYVVPAYYTIATAEASANLARFNGIRYGLRPEGTENPEQLVKGARNRGFGDEVKLRILLGTYVLRSGFQDRYYVRAQKVRTAIRNDLQALFGAVDLLLLPVFPTAAFKHGEAGLTPFQQKLADRFTVTANLAGIPALSFPMGSEAGAPLGLQLLAPAFEEERLFRAAESFAEAVPLEHPPGYSEEWRS